MNNVYLKLFFGSFISLLFTYYLVPIFIRVAYKCNMIDQPDGVIKKHAQATPYLGGAAIYLGFLISLGIVFPFDNQFFLFLIGSTLLFYVGLIDDIIALRPAQKFVGQAIAVLCYLKAGFFLKSHLFFNVWNIPISALWMMLVINAFNLIDIMDGLCTLVAICASLSFLLIALFMQQYTVAILLCAFVGALFAFLRFNMPKAKIYLGDAGSLFIGGFLATVPFLFNWGILHPYGYIIPLIILAIPLLEVGGLILIRTHKKIPFYYATPDHFAIYLKNKGWSIHKILIFVVIAAILLIASSILFAYGLMNIHILFILGSLFLVFWFYCIFF